MRSIKSATVLLAMILLVMDQSCVSHDFPSVVCPADPVGYVAQVHPIVMSKCAITDCHGSDPNIPDWTDFATFRNAARGGNVRNYVLNRIMPPAESPAGPLSREEINLIVCWIDQGAEDN